MEEDIKILEDLINAKITFTISPSDYGWKAIEHLIKGYKQLVDIAIETAFDDTNNDTELLCRVLLKQGQITLENGMYHREKFDWEKHFKMLGLEKVREKAFFLQDSQIDEYTKQLEYKIKELEKQKAEISDLKWKNEIYVKSIKSHDRYEIELNDEIIKKNNKIFDLEAEIEKKDKMIDLMAIAIDNKPLPTEEYCIFRNFDCPAVGGNRDCKQCIKQYFEKKSEE